jgi:hypothetical protein
VPEDFRYASDNNTEWLDEAGIAAMINEAV